jgi:hypothetical protein
LWAFPRRLIQTYPRGMDGPSPVTVEQYVHFEKQGLLIVAGVLAPCEVRELLDHAADLLAGRVELAGAAAFGETNKAPGDMDVTSLPVAIASRKRIPTAGGR